MPEVADLFLQHREWDLQVEVREHAVGPGVGRDHHAAHSRDAVVGDDVDFTINRPNCANRRVAVQRRTADSGKLLHHSCALAGGHNTGLR